jgi:hypothetical protein
LENGTLKNKASLWQSTATWTFEEFNKTLIKIKDNAANKFLGAQSDGKVVRKDRKYNEEVRPLKRIIRLALMAYLDPFKSVKQLTTE